MGIVISAGVDGMLQLCALSLCLSDPLSSYAEERVGSTGWVAHVFDFDLIQFDAIVYFYDLLTAVGSRMDHNGSWGVI